MVTRSAWERATIAAWSGETCTACGRMHPITSVDEDGCIWSYCPQFDRDCLVGYEPVPVVFDPEPPQEDDLPW